MCAFEGDPTGAELIEVRCLAVAELLAFAHDVVAEGVKDDADDVHGMALPSVWSCVPSISQHSGVRLEEELTASRPPAITTP